MAEVASWVMEFDNISFVPSTMSVTNSVNRFACSFSQYFPMFPMDLPSGRFEKEFHVYPVSFIDKVCGKLNCYSAEGLFRYEQHVS